MSANRIREWRDYPAGDRPPARCSSSSIARRVSSRPQEGVSLDRGAIHCQSASLTQEPGLFFRRAQADISRFDVEAFELEILDTLTPRQETTAREAEQELAALDALWRETLGPERLY